MGKKWVAVHEHLGHFVEVLQNAEAGDDFNYRVMPPVLIAENGKIVKYKTVDEAVQSIDMYADLHD